MPARQASPPPERPPETKPSSPPGPALTSSGSGEEKISVASGSSVAVFDENNSDIYQHSNYVYILDPVHSWIPAQITERSTTTTANGQQNNNNIIHLSVPQYKTEQAIQCDGGRNARGFQKKQVNLSDPKNLIKFPHQHLPLQNVNSEGELQVVEDMVDLPFLHEVCLFVCFSRGRECESIQKVNNITVMCLKTYHFLNLFLVSLFKNLS
jgi:hypothetical protein